MTSQQRRAIVIDTDISQHAALIAHLTGSGWQVAATSSTVQARKRLTEGHVDIVVLGRHQEAHLQLMHDTRAGRIAGASPGQTFIALGIGDERTALAYYQAGASVTLPHRASPSLVAAACDSAADKDRAKSNGVQIVGDLTLDYRSRSASVRDTPLHLTRKEFDLLAHMATNPDRLQPRATISHALYGSDYVARHSKVIDAYIFNTNKKAQAAGLGRIYQNSRGQGYTLSTEQAVLRNR